MTDREAAPAGRRDGPRSEALRQNVRLLTTMLGDAIAESGGPELLGQVEALRKAAIAFRGRPTDARRRRVTDLVAALDLARAEDVIRAFTCYFQLVNLAEERHRVRTLRSRSRSGRPVEDSIAALDVDPSSFEDLRITPVLTAHPTEAKRRAVVEHLWRIGALLEQLEDLSLGASEEQEVRRRMREEIAGLWRTDPIRPHRPEPLDEVRAVLALFDQTIFTTLPTVYREMDRRIDADGCGTRPPSFEPFLRWGTWVGGDRDGNPRVTAEVTRAAMAIQSDHVLRGLEAASRRIARTLSVSDRDVPPSRALRRALERDAEALPAVARELGRTLSDAPHRRKLGLSAHRLAATRTGGKGGYDGPASFLRDLDVLQRSLDAGGAPRLAWGELQHLRWQVETFGFHLASMEVRQHSSVLAAARAELASPRSARPSAATREVLATFRAIADIQARLGVEACERVIVSFTRSAADLAGVLDARARGRAGVTSRRGAGASPRIPSGAHHRGLDPGRLAVDAAGAPPVEATRRRAGGDGRILRLRQGGRHARGEPRALRGATGDDRLGARSRRATDDLPRTGRRARARWRSREPGDRGAAAGVGRGPAQGDRAGRGGVRAVRERRARTSAPGAADERGRAGERPRTRGRSGGRVRPGDRDHVGRVARPLRAARAGGGVRGVLPAGDADRADRHVADRVASGRARHGRVDGAGRSPRDPVGVRVGTEPREPHRLVRTRRRPLGGDVASRWPRPPPGDGARLAVLRDAARERRAVARQGRSGDRRSLSGTK